MFEPTFQKHAKQTCGGCQIHVTDRDAFRPVLTGVALIQMFRRLDPADSSPGGSRPYEYEHDKLPIDILAGSDALRQQIEAGIAADEIAAQLAARTRRRSAAARAVPAVLMPIASDSGPRLRDPRRLHLLRASAASGDARSGAPCSSSNASCGVLARCSRSMSRGAIAPHSAIGSRFRIGSQ